MQALIFKESETTEYWNMYLCIFKYVRTVFVYKRLELRFNLKRRKFFLSRKQIKCLKWLSRKLLIFDFREMTHECGLFRCYVLHTKSSHTGHIKLKDLTLYRTRRHGCFTFYMKENISFINYSFVIQGNSHLMNWFRFIRIKDIEVHRPL